VILDGAHSTHLSTSLKDLESLNIAAVSVAGGGLTVDLGSADFNGLVGGLPAFTGGPVTLALDSDAHGGITELNAIANLAGGSGAGLTADLDTLANHGISDISIEQLAAGDFSSDSALAALHNLDAAIHLADQAHAGHATGDHLTLSITDAQAGVLASHHFGSFDSSMDVSVHGHSTHLSTSLKDLEILNVGHVDIANGLIGTDSIEHVSIDLGSISLNSSEAIHNLENALPYFSLDASEAAKGAIGLDVTVDLTHQQLSDLAYASPSISSELLAALNDAGITGIGSVDSLEAAIAGPADWMNVGTIEQLHSHGFNYEQHLVGSSDHAAPISLDAALDKELASLVDDGTLNANAVTATDHALHGIDLLNFTTPDKFGDLLHALTASGVSDFVVDSGDVVVSDALASALVDAGMLQALPDANLVLDVSAQVVENYAHLATSLKAMAELGVNGIETGHADHLYIDLGLPVHDASAMSDISHLLSTLDPANHATDIAHNQDGKPVDISLVISGDVASAIAEAGGFTAADALHLENLGIKQIAVVETPGHAANAADALFNAASSAHVELPPVQLIGAPDPMHDELLNHSITHPTK
jgi:hypothetical protein